MRAALERWRSELVPEWTIVLLFAQPEPDAAGETPRASVECADDYHTAVVRLDRDWRNGWADNAPPGIVVEVEVEVALVHELFHVLLRDVEHWVGVDLEDRDPDGRLRIWFDHAEEGFIERAARALVTARHAAAPA